MTPIAHNYTATAKTYGILLTNSEPQQQTPCLGCEEVQSTSMAVANSHSDRSCRIAVGVRAKKSKASPGSGITS